MSGAPPAPTPPEPGTPAPRRPRVPRWRVFAVVAFVLAGALFVTSSLDSRAGALRSASVTDLSTLVRDQRKDSDAQQQRVAMLNRQVGALTRDVKDARVKTLQDKVDRVRGPAGLEPVSGPGLTVTLQDAPDDVLDKAIADGTPSTESLLVHQQDIQAVVNALWLGGARAISIMDQRIVFTTGIKCAGPTVILHGVPYSPPYVIKAVGDPEQLATALDGSDYIDAYRVVADRYGLGFETEASGDLTLPGYEGTTTLRYARALGTSG